MSLEGGREGGGREGGREGAGRQGGREGGSREAGREGGGRRERGREGVSESVTNKLPELDRCVTISHLM